MLWILTIALLTRSLKAQNIAQMQVQSGSHTLYESSYAYRSVSRYANISFTNTYTSYPVCNWGMGEMMTSENKSSLYYLLYYYQIYDIERDSLDLQIRYYVDTYSDANIDMGLMKFSMSWVCMLDFYDNLWNRYQWVYYGDEWYDGTRYSEKTYTFPSSQFVPSEDSSRNILCHHFEEVHNYYPFNVTTSIELKNSTAFTVITSTDLNTRIRGDIDFYFFFINLDGFPVGEQYISSGTIELSDTTTELNFDYQDFLYLGVNFVSMATHRGVELDFEFSEDQASNKTSFEIGGLYAATVRYFIVGTGSQLLGNQLIQFCNTRDSQFLCTSCVSGYNLTSSPGYCIPKIDNCRSMVTQNDSLCHLCHVGSKLSDDQLSCVPFVDNCATMLSYTQCDVCEAGYNLTTDKRACAADIENCKTMVPVTLDKCQKCYTGFYLTADELECISCGNISAECIECDDALTCTLCNEGFFLPNSTDCLACESVLSNCSNCSTNGSECYQCQTDQFFISQFQCAECSESIEGCDRCLDNETCLVCVNNSYFLDESYKCPKCRDEMPNCHLCDSSGAICEECDLTYFWDGSACDACDQMYCLRCSDKNSCLECEEGYLVHSSGNCTCPQGTFYVPHGCTSVFGCMSAYPLSVSNGSVECLLCHPDFYYNKTLRECVCQMGYRAEGDQCVERCGDGIHFSQQCDDSNRISGDGCSWECEVEYGYVCDDGAHPNYDKSLCRLDFQFSIKYLYVKKVDGENKGEVHFELIGDDSADKLNILGTYELSKYASVSDVPSSQSEVVFQQNLSKNRLLSASAFPIDAVSVDSHYRKLILTFSYEQSHVDKEITANFDFSQFIKGFASQSVQFTTKGMQPPLEYSENAGILYALEVVVTVVAYASLLFFLISLTIHRNIGAETLNTIQMSFCCLLLIRNELDVFRLFHPLSLSMGITPIIDNSWSSLISPQTFRTFSDSRSVINNINLFLFALLLVFSAYSVLFCKKKYYKRQIEKYNRIIKKGIKSKVNDRSGLSQLVSEAKENKMHVSDLLFHTNNKQQFVYERLLYPLCVFLIPATIFVLTREVYTSIEDEPHPLTKGTGSNLWEILLFLIVMGFSTAEIRGGFHERDRQKLHKVDFPTLKQSCRKGKPTKYITFYNITAVMICCGIVAMYSLSEETFKISSYVFVGLTVFFAIFTKCYSPYSISIHNSFQSLNYLLVGFSLGIVMCDRSRLLEESSAIALSAIYIALVLGILVMGVYRLILQQRQNHKNDLSLNQANVEEEINAKRQNVKETLDQNPYIYRNQAALNEKGSHNHQDLNDQIRRGYESNKSLVTDPKKQLQLVKQRLRREFKAQEEQQAYYEALYPEKRSSEMRRLF